MTPDRVSYSFGLKINGPKQYESTNVQISFSSDVRSGESAESALNRVVDFVENEVDQKLSELRAAYGSK